MSRKKKHPKLESWKLLDGSHPFPGPDGGTCINEAAIVARGFAYKVVREIRDLPPCFSRVIGAFALKLNDEIQDDALRTELLSPYVVQIAGTADTKKVEIKRAKYILSQINRIIASNSLLDDVEPDMFEGWDELKRAANILTKPFKQWSDEDVDWLLLKTGDGVTIMSSKIKNTNQAATSVMDAFGELDLSEEQTCKALTAVLGKAIKMGKHAKVADIKTINKRLREYKQKAGGDLSTSD